MRIFKLLGTPTLEEFPRQTELAQYQRVLQLPRYPRRSVRELVVGLDEAGYDLLEQMIVFDPDKRISAEDALNHPFFDDVVVGTMHQDAASTPIVVPRHS